MTETVRPVAVVGPTATGKSDLALELAERLGGEIVNIDAMQLYRGMDIGTAKLPPDQRRGIPHHQLDVLEVTETATVAAYQVAASADIEAIMARGRLPVIVGGSMMYVQALLDQWEFPATDPQVRAKWEALLAEGGVAAVHAALRQADPAAAATILPTDGRRMVRALEVVELTGKPFAASAPAVGEPRWGTRILGVDRDTTELDARIAQRTASMFDTGLVEEVRGLIGRGLREGQTARRAIGYAQVLAFLDQEYDLDAARERTFIGTRRYVRRQRSWFRRDHRVRWVDAANPAATDIAISLLDDSAGPVTVRPGVGAGAGAGPATVSDAWPATVSDAQSNAAPAVQHPGLSAAHGPAESSSHNSDATSAHGPAASVPFDPAVPPVPDSNEPTMHDPTVSPAQEPTTKESTRP